jgi:hypothetical protein
MSSPRLTAGVILPILAAAAYFTIGLVRISVGHPAEDAYIVYKYVDNFAAGRGIVYYAGGPHTEGFVDFLWFIALGGLVRLGMDVAVAAIALNAMGVAVLTRIFYAQIESTPSLSVLSRHVLQTAACAFVLLSCASLAGWEGFSTTLYAAAVLLLYFLSLRDSTISRAAIPCAALAVALLRSDGAVIAIGFTVLGFAQAWRAGDLLRYLTLCAASTLAGAAYFAWRSSYFGLPLPLPFYVKSALSHLPGLRDNIRWFFLSVEPLFLTFAAAGFLGFLAGKGSSLPRRLLWAALPLLAHFLALSFFAQYQNIQWRFQAPLTTALLFITFAGFSSLVGLEITIRQRVGWALIFLTALAPLSAIGLRRIYRSIRYQPTYIDTFAPLLGQRLGPRHTLAITEAGRLAYWSSSIVRDFTGLNDPEAARFPPLQSDIERMGPDLVLFHHAWTLDTSSLEGRRAPIIPLDSATLDALVQKKHRNAFEDNPPRGRRLTGDPISDAALVLARFLRDQAELYDIYAVCYGGEFTHIYGLKKSLPEKPMILEDLRHTQKGAYLSYAAAKRLWSVPLKLRKDPVTCT